MEINQLSEVKAHKNPNCKWYRNSVLDLTVEYSLGGSIQSFQLEFIDRNNSYSINWDHFNLKNYVFDEGDSDPMKNQTPIVRAELSKSPAYLKDNFIKYSQNLSPEIRAFVLDKI